jgi:hypothetical protein
MSETRYWITRTLIVAVFFGTLFLLLHYDQISCCGR